jgi:hypothetical protein
LSNVKLRDKNTSLVSELQLQEKRESDFPHNCQMGSWFLCQKSLMSWSKSKWKEDGPPFLVHRGQDQVSRIQDTQSLWYHQLSCDLISRICQSACYIISLLFSFLIISIKTSKVPRQPPPQAHWYCKKPSTWKKQTWKEAGGCSSKKGSRGQLG